jgi:osmotically-inducible protein OsmY
MTGKTTRAIEDDSAAVFAGARKRLDNCPTVPGTVRVHVEDGTVTLTGTVPLPSQRAEAERVVQPVIGHRRLLNKITVAPGTESVDIPGERGHE